MPMFLYFDQMKESFLNAWGLLVLRVGVGSLMLFGHGWGKLSNFSAIAPNFPDPLGFGSGVSLGLAVFAEFFCSLALIFGFLTRVAAIPLIITMLMAAFVIHAADPFKKMELALVYLVPFLTILLSGPGKYSIDRLMFKKQIEF